MNLSLEAIQNLLGIKEKIPLTPGEMAKTLRITFFPFSTESKKIGMFAKRLKLVIEDLGIEIMPYEKAIKLKNGKEKIKKGVITFILGETKEDNLPVDYITTSTDNPVVAIIDMPGEIKENLSYEAHMGIGLNLFTWHMSNIIVCVDEKKWIIYSFNGSSPFYKIDGSFKQDVLNNLIPKIATRVRPLRTSEFKIRKVKHSFIDDVSTRPFVKDLVESGPLLAQTGLFQPVKKVEEFKYRNEFYRRVAYLHLDERKGMSYGFIARQLPLKLPDPVPFEDIKQKLRFQDKDYVIKENKRYILIRIGKEAFALEVPPIWVLMSRSGCEKTKLDPFKDILKIGLVNGEMIMEVPTFIEMGGHYRPSFDTRLIFSHCLASTIYGAVLKKVKKHSLYPNKLESKGLAIAHWHKEILPKIPQEWYVYGEDFPPVLCSSPQTAIYAFKGKEAGIKQSLLTNNNYLGDIYIEPHHGVNITWETLKGLGYYLLSDPFIAKSKEVSL